MRFVRRGSDRWVHGGVLQLQFRGIADAGPPLLFPLHETMYTRVELRPCESPPRWESLSARSVAKVAILGALRAIRSPPAEFHHAQT